MKRFYILVTAVAILVGCTGASSETMLNARRIILRSPQGGETAVIAEIADTPTEWEVGLMNRKELAKHSGMLFVFAAERPMTFWMKNTLIPLDILFFDSQKRFISAQAMEPCTADPCAVYSSARPGLYALEVPAGFTSRLGVGEGWTLVDSRTP
jgi:uncharacterized protein